MFWLSLSLITALAVATRDVSVKAFRELNPMDIAGIELFWSLPLLTLGLLIIPIPELDGTFWWNFGISFPLNALAYIIYLYAIKQSPLSLSVPFLAFTPVFMLITAPMVLGESINLWGGAGIALIVSGGYVLNINSSTESIWQPFQSFLKEKGAGLMMVVALLFAFTAVVGKKAIIHSSPLFFSYLFFVIFNLLILFGLLLHRGGSKASFILRQPGKGTWLGSLLFFHVSCHGVAISLTTAAYMVAVKRSSILFCVLLSWLVLKEGNRAWRGLGSALMFCGILLISVKG